MNVKIGVSQSLFKKTMGETGIYLTFKRLSELGIRYIELTDINLSNKEIETIKKTSTEFGINIVAIKVAINKENTYYEVPMNLTADYDSIVCVTKTLGCNNLRIDSVKPETFETVENILAYTYKCEEIALKLEKEDILLHHTNNPFEFTRFDKLTGLEIIMNNSTKLGVDLSTFWIQYGGLKPEDLIRKYNGRGCMMHLEDYRIATRKPDLPMVRPKIGQPTPNSLLIRFSEIGEGNLQIENLIVSSNECNREFIIIRQGKLYGKSEFQSITKSVENLKAIKIIN